MRLLGPDAYGLIGMALVFIGFANIFQNFGFGSALIQRSLLAKSHYSSTFFLNIGIGMILTTTFILVAPLISLFYGNEDILKVIQVLSFSFLFASLGIVPKSLMQRRMRFDIISKIEIITTVIPGIIAVILAFMEFGVWALVFQNLMMILMSSILYLKKVDW